jgi:hypothetical protein
MDQPGKNINNTQEQSAVELKHFVLKSYPSYCASFIVIYCCRIKVFK